jgi:hypothetical protein
MKQFVTAVALATLMGCASTTIINSEPSGAAVYLNGEKLGVTPYTYTDTKIVDSTNVVILKKEGYQDFTAVFSRNEEANVGALIGGVFVWVPFLWAMNYKPSHSYEMVPLKAEANQ